MNPPPPPPHPHWWIYIYSKAYCKKKKKKSYSHSFKITCDKSEVSAQQQRIAPHKSDQHQQCQGRQLLSCDILKQFFMVVNLFSKNVCPHEYNFVMELTCQVYDINNNAGIIPHKWCRGIQYKIKIKCSCGIRRNYMTKYIIIMFFSNHQHFHFILCMYVHLPQIQNANSH